MTQVVVSCGALALHVKKIAQRRGWDIEVRPVPPELHQLFMPAAAQLPPVDALPSYAPLPPGSLMPLHRNPLFVGRAAELPALAAALASGDTVVITGMGGMGKTQLAAEFAEHRAVLVGAAYRVVGSMVDAEDVVQETWLRWAAAVWCR